MDSDSLREALGEFVGEAFEELPNQIKDFFASEKELNRKRLAAFTTKIALETSVSVARILETFELLLDLVGQKQLLSAAEDESVRVTLEPPPPPPPEEALGKMEIEPPAPPDVQRDAIIEALSHVTDDDQQDAE